jgi:uncharacterized protein
MDALPVQESRPRALETAGPVTRAERIPSLDVLRGFALLGILVMNVQLFAMIDATLFNPTSYGDLTGVNFLVWLLSHLLFDQKFMTIFSMLFGAGIVLMTQRAEAAGRGTAGRHYLRMLWLAIMGLLHAHLLWYGDILYLYAICGLWTYLFRKLRPGWLLGVGLVVISVSSLLFLFFGWSLQFWPEESLLAMARDWQPDAARIGEEVAIYRSSWLGQMEHRVPTALEFQLFVIFVWGIWRAGGLMLVGMGLFKLGFFSAERSRRTYWTAAVIGLAVGLPPIIYGVVRHFEAEWAVEYSMFFGTQFNYWGSLAVSLAWVSLVMLWCRSAVLSALKRSLAAVGQMALTNYLAHSLICTTIFYGHGLGLFGKVERVGQVGIVVAIWIAQLVISPIWLRHFRFGPAEWAWRSLTYLKAQPLRRSNS